MGHIPSFDDDDYITINEARWQAAEALLNLLPSPPANCLDVGCGPGWFARRLCARGMTVLGVDGRPELVRLARERVPGALFKTADVCNPSDMRNLPRMDLVFCFGLLYHLENPATAIRSLLGLGDVLLIETQVAPYDNAILQLVKEGKFHTQGLTYLAAIPSRAALVRLLYEAGAKVVQRYVAEIPHEDFKDTATRRHRREVFLVSKTPIPSDTLVVEPLPPAPKLDVRRI